MCESCNLLLKLCNTSYVKSTHLCSVIIQLQINILKMKKSIFVFIVSAFSIAILSTSCNTPAEKVENAIDKVNKANADLAKANEDYNNEVDAYRKEEAAKIAVNDISIAEFKARITTQKKEAKSKYLKDIADLEQKNSDMKKELDIYKAESKENWAVFKVKFSHDMDELGKAFKGFVTPVK
jgi:F0F1-type ATP synthase membrane subunit b/b'